MELLVSLISGAVGGNLAGGAMRSLDQGRIVNTVLGLVGGGLGGQILTFLGGNGVGAMASAGFSLGDVAGQVASGGLGGAFLMTLVGLVRNVTRRD